MSIVLAVRRSLAAQVAVLLAGLVLALTALAGIILTVQQRRQLEESTLEKARVAAAIGAQQYGEVVDKAIDAGKLYVNDAFDKNYILISGYEFGKNPKYHTRYDSVLDREVLPLIDQFLKDDDFVYAIGVDENGYIPTHNGKFTLPITGNPEKDLLGNRTKRIANYGEGLAAAKNLQPVFVQEYVRNTGEKMWDVSAPIYVKAKHWGAFRLGVSMQRIAARQRALFYTLTGLFALFFAVTTGTMYLVLRRAMQPVVALTTAAEQISLGEALDTPIKSAAVDEIAHLTKAIDRLRASMKAAMSRLGQ
jgi:hypothetical protein